MIRLAGRQPCDVPRSGSQGSSPAPPAKQVAAIEGMIPRAVKRNIAAIAVTELSAIEGGRIAKTVPFLGILMGFVYIGHSVWTFEGHPRFDFTRPFWCPMGQPCGRRSSSRARFC